MARSTWMAPLLCLLVSYACYKIPASWQVRDVAPGTAAYAALIFLSIAAVLSFLLLLSCVVYGLRRAQGRGERVCRLLWAVGAGVPCLAWALMLPYSLVCITEAHVADDWSVPEGVPFVVPASFALTDTAPETARRLVREQSLSEVVVWTDPEGEMPAKAEHAEALAQHHPELLRELWLRSLMLDNKNIITAKAMDTEHLLKDSTVLLHPEGLAAGYALEANQRGELTTTALASQEGRLIGDVGSHPPVSATEKLGGGWQLSFLTKEGFRPCRDEGLEALARYRIDKHLSELAADPNLATLDRLLPVTPCPGLRLRQTCLGYHLTLCLPKEARTDGHYTLRAFEYESGTPLKLDPRAHTIRPAAMTALAAHRLRFFDSFKVRTGRDGQFYGSRWQIVFIPDAGPEEILSEQLFLMMGRW